MLIRNISFTETDETYHFGLSLDWTTSYKCLMLPFQQTQEKRTNVDDHVTTLFVFPIKYFREKCSLQIVEKFMLVIFTNIIVF